MLRTCAGTVSLVLWILAGATPASARTLVVDNDRAQCRTAEYRTIQAAIDAADPGDRVSVCAGAYREQVFIHPELEGLVVESTPRRTATILPPKQFVEHPRLRAIVVAAARHNVVRGFRILGPLPPNPECNGAFTHDVGVQIGAAFSLIEDNQIYDIRDNCNKGGGIWSGDAQSELDLGLGGSDSVVRGNVIEQYRRFGIIVENVAQGRPVRIVDNVIAGAQSRPTAGVIAGQESLVHVEGNFVHSNSSVGISLSGQFTGDHVARDNRVRGNTTGIRASSDGGSYISGNDVSASRASGIVVGWTDSPGHVVNNISRDNVGHGIDVLANPRGGVVSANQSLRNRGDGIRIDGGAGIQIDGNTALGNLGVDCRDLGPFGTGTAETFNFWTANKGRTSSPAGLCQP